jgi:hypothetical protein
MKKKYLIVFIACILLNQMTFSQQLEQRRAEELAITLNTKIAPNFLLELNGNKGLVKIDQLNKTLDLRDNYAISQDSIINKPKTGLNTKRDGGHVFWLFNFQPTTNFKVAFKPNKYRQIFCTIFFRDDDTISIKSKLNIYTSHHKLSDSALHTVEWSGAKYMSFLLAPKWVSDNLKMEVRGITISGNFQRRDQKLISKNYTKSLRKVLRREFEQLFESEEMTKLLSQILK